MTKATVTAPVVDYTVSVTIRRAVRPDHDVTTVDAAAWMIGAEAKRELEREVLRALRVLDGDCDCEVMDSEFKSEL